MPHKNLRTTEIHYVNKGMHPKIQLSFHYHKLLYGNYLRPSIRRHCIQEVGITLLQIDKVTDMTLDGETWLLRIHIAKQLVWGWDLVVIVQKTLKDGQYSFNFVSGDFMKPL